VRKKGDAYDDEICKREIVDVVIVAKVWKSEPKWNGSKKYGLNDGNVVVWTKSVT